jgi:tetraacyldisaccharide 4'-kinase
MRGIVKYLLYPVSFLYGYVMFVRNVLFDISLFRQSGIGVPVISIGNITAGGTGKTPMTVYLAERLQQSGLSVGILSRGYKRGTKGYLLVSDGSGPMVDHRDGGDEPVLLAERVRGTCVAVDENRIRGGRRLVKEQSIGILLLDDGFQHRWIRRDLDIVLVDAERRDDLRSLLPVGRLREGLPSLRRADLIIVTKAGDEVRFRSLEKLIQRYTARPILRAALVPVAWVDVADNRCVNLDELPGPSAYLFTGIAHPGDVRSTVESIGITVVGLDPFPDHYRYTEADLQSVIGHAESKGAGCIVTTEKDSMRIGEHIRLFAGRIPLYALRVRFEMVEDDWNVLNRYIQRIRHNKQ